MICVVVFLSRTDTNGLIVLPRKYNPIFTEKTGKTLAQ